MKKFFRNLKKTWEFTKDEKGKIILYLLLSLLIMGISLVVPIFSAKVIVNLTSNKLYELLIISIIILIIELFRNIIRFFSSTTSQKLYRNILIKIQVKMGEEILKLNNETLIENGSGVFNQRINSDTSSISDLIPLLLSNITDILTNIGIFIAIFIISKPIFIYLLISMIICYFINNKRTTKRTKNLKTRKKEQERVSSFSSELCRGAKDIKMLSSEKSFLKEYKQRIEKVNNAAFHMMQVDRSYFLLSGSVKDIIDFGFIALICYLLSKSFMTIPMALVIYNYKDKVSSIIYYINNTLEYIKEYNLSSERVFDIIDGESFKKEKFGKKTFLKLNGNIEFRNVNFSYNDTKVLKNLSFKINSGKTISIVGKSGEGKSTIFNLLCKFYNVKDNMIYLDGEDINSLTKETIRDNMTIISQDPYIFNMTIRENFELVKEGVTLDRIKEVCKIACLDDYIESLSNKYETIIGEGGINLSGGQKQRLAIARALLQDTEIILFDEATSSLDNETQKKIQEAINNMKGNYTILIIAHRFSTVINSDKIFYIEKGQVASAGTHKELLEKCKAYKELYEAEFID